MGLVGGGRALDLPRCQAARCRVAFATWVANAWGVAVPCRTGVGVGSTRLPLCTGLSTAVLPPMFGAAAVLVV